MSALTPEELRAVQIDILNEIDAFCRQHGISYYLAWGTLLGAVRHKGYIPWDDDIDLMMRRPDYERFCHTFATSNNPNLQVDAPEITTEWSYPFAKIHDRRTILEEETELAHSIGVNVDIFPIDTYAPGRVARKLQLLRVRFCLALLALKSIHPKVGRRAYRAVALRVSKPVVRRIPSGVLVRRASRSASSHDESPSTSVGVLVGPRVWNVDEADLGKGIDVEFEGRRYPAPKNWDSVLTSTYGQYMVLPPEEQRQTHHAFVARWLNQQEDN